MNKHKIKIGKDLSDRLDTLARGLPAVAAMDGNGKVISRKVQVLGQQLIDDRYDSGGTEINPNIMYNVNKITFVNHRQQLEIAYRKDGEEGIARYLTYCKTLKTAADVQMSKKLADKVWYRRWWFQIKMAFFKPKIEISK